MTREEAIRNINALNAVCGQKPFYDNEFEEALGIAVEALENQKSLQAELEEIKAEVIEQIEYFSQYKEDKDYDLGSYDAYNYMLSVINEHIAELKGENE